jgi:hypothetical protein
MKGSVVLISLDEKEIRKEKKRMEKEERRALKQAKMKKAKEKPEQNNKPKLKESDKKKIMGVVIAFILIILIFVFKDAFINYLNNAGRDDTYESYLLLTDVTGYSEEDAIEKLRNIGFVNIKRSYIIDQFTEDGCVVKTNYHINSQLKPDEEIILYICDKSLYLTENETDSNDISWSANKTYFSMDGVTIVDLTIKDGYFYCIVKNNNKEAMKNISYKIGYQDASGIEIGEYKYDLDSDTIILPGEKMELSGEIKSSSAKYLYVSGFTYDKEEVPEEERK